MDMSIILMILFPCHESIISHNTSLTPIKCVIHEIHSRSFLRYFMTSKMINYKFYIAQYVLTAIMVDRKISIPVIRHFNQSLNPWSGENFFEKRFLPKRKRKTNCFMNRDSKARIMIERVREVVTGMMLGITTEWLTCSWKMQLEKSFSLKDRFLVGNKRSKLESLK